MNTTKLLKLADFLDTLSPDKFNFSEVVTRYDGDCGSICCAIGWTPAVFPDEVKWVRGSPRLMSPKLEFIRSCHSPVEYINIAATLFDITASDAAGLFTPRMQFDFLGPAFGNLSREATPKQIAALIRQYISIRTSS